MKKIAGKIAMILLLVLLANTFTGCFTYALHQEVQSGGWIQLLVICTLGLPYGFALIIDFFMWPFELVDLAQGGDGTGRKRSASSPEDDAAFIAALIAQLPETEHASAMEHINAIPEEYLPSAIKVMRALFSLPYADRVILIEAIQNLPESDRAFLTETASSLSGGEMSALADELLSIPTKEMSRQIKSLHETPHEELVDREYVAARFAAVKQ